MLALGPQRLVSTSTGGGVLTPWAPADLAPRAALTGLPTSWSFVKQSNSYTVRHNGDLKIPFESVSLVTNPGLVATNVVGTTMALSYGSSALTFANSAASSAEAVAQLFGLRPFTMIEVDVSNIAVGSAGIEYRKDANNRVIFRANPSGSFTTEIVQAGISGGEVQLSAGPMPAAPYTIRLQNLGRSAVVGYVVSGSYTYLGTLDYSTSFDFRDPTIIAGWSVNLNVRGGQNTSVTVSRLANFLSSVGQADIRIVSFEDGTPIQDAAGYLYALMTCRGSMINNAFQGIFKINLATLDIQMTGALFGDRGDGIWRNDNAGHLFYDRIAKNWKWLVIGHSDDPTARGVYTSTLQFDPRNLVSVVPSTQLTVGINGQFYEDMYPTYDAAAGKWVAVASKGASISVRLEAVAFTGAWTEVLAAGTNETGNLIITSDGIKYGINGTAGALNLIRNYDTLASIANITQSGGNGNRVWPVIVAYMNGAVAQIYMLSFNRLLVAGTYSYGGLELHKKT